MIFEPKSSQRRDLFEKFSNDRKTEQTNEKTERTNENRIVQVVVIAGRVSGFRDCGSFQKLYSSGFFRAAAPIVPWKVLDGPELDRPLGKGEA